MNQSKDNRTFISRRDFLQAVGGTAAGITLTSGGVLGAGVATASSGRTPAQVRGAFTYPPTESLRKAGYYSWPGSTFDAEARQKQYSARLQDIQKTVGMRIVMDREPLDTSDDASRFISQVKEERPQGLLLIPFKKSHWTNVTRIVEETKLPTVILASLGILLVGHVREMHDRPGVFMINSLDNLEAVTDGMRMIATAHRMRESCILNIRGDKETRTAVPHIGTTVHTIPRMRFVEHFRRTEATDDVTRLASSYLDNAKQVFQPTTTDVVEAAKTYVALKNLAEEEKADALMMDCLPGLARPHTHVPPCMGFMSLRDEGFPCGCESDLDATLTMMLLQNLFNKPAFQHNPTAETEKNHYFCAHCTSASRMNGPDAPAEPYMLMNHAEAGWGCVPRVLFKPGQDVTITKYLSTKAGSEAAPQMLVYSGQIVGCPPVPRTGGCRTNAETTINELDNVCELQGHHLCMVYGNYAKRLREFCRLYQIEAVV